MMLDSRDIYTTFKSFSVSHCRGTMKKTIQFDVLSDWNVFSFMKLVQLFLGTDKNCLELQNEDDQKGR